MWLIALILVLGLMLMLDVGIQLLMDSIAVGSELGIVIGLVMILLALLVISLMVRIGLEKDES